MTAQKYIDTREPKVYEAVLNTDEDARDVLIQWLQEASVETGEDFDNGLIADRLLEQSQVAIRDCPVAYIFRVPGFGGIQLMHPAEVASFWEDATEEDSSPKPSQEQAWLDRAALMMLAFDDLQATAQDEIDTSTPADAIGWARAQFMEIFKVSDS